MELAILITFGVFMSFSFYLGVKAGKGEVIDLGFKKFKPILRTPEEEAKLIEKHRSKK